MAVVIVSGRPVSINASPKRRRIWGEIVAAAAREVFEKPLTANDLRVTIVFFHKEAPNFDIDNVSKPVCDALQGVAYENDYQIADRNAHRRSIDGAFRLVGVDPKIALALTTGNDFLSIDIHSVGDGIVNI